MKKYLITLLFIILININISAWDNPYVLTSYEDFLKSKKTLEKIRNYEKLTDEEIFQFKPIIIPQNKYKLKREVVSAFHKIFSEKTFQQKLTFIEKFDQNAKYIDWYLSSLNVYELIEFCKKFSYYTISLSNGNELFQMFNDEATSQMIYAMFYFSTFLDEECGGIGRITEKINLELPINEKIKYLKIKNPYSFENLKKIINACSNLEFLELDSYDFTNSEPIFHEKLKALEIKNVNLKQLEELLKIFPEINELDINNIQDEIPDNICPQNNIEELSISKISNYQLQKISKLFPKLVDFFAVELKIKALDFERFISSCPLLRSICIDEIEGEIKNPIFLKNLEDLDIDKISANNLLKIIKNNNKINSITIGTLEGDFEEDFSKLEKLIYLNVSDINANALEKILQKTSMLNNLLLDEIKGKISEKLDLKYLEELRLRTFNEMDNFNNIVSKSIKSLKSLEFDDVKIPLHSIPSFENLEFLWFEGKISSFILEEILEKCSKKLTKLHIKEILGDLQELPSFPNLKFFTGKKLSSNNFSLLLSKMPNVKKIYLKQILDNNNLNIFPISCLKKIKLGKKIQNNHIENILKSQNRSILMKRDF